MKLTEMQLQDFCRLLASDAPAPGGGSASALAGAVGIGLGEMVANLTLGKKKYADYQDNAKEMQAASAKLLEELIRSVDKDTEAFDGVSAVFAMPKETDEEKAARKAAMQSALKEATKAPFEVMEQCLAALKVVEQGLGKTNQSAASDLGVAALNLRSGLQGAWLNVLINLGGIKDEAFVAQYRQAGEDILAQGLPLAERIYQTVLESL